MRVYIFVDIPRAIDVEPQINPIIEKEAIVNIIFIKQLTNKAQVL